jgi:hypothetical protein
MVKSGYILGLIGGTIMLVFGLEDIQLNMSIIILGGLTSPIPLYARVLNLVVPIVWGVLGITGAVIGLRGTQMGDYLMLIAGIGGLAGTFIPIAMYEMVPSYMVPVFLNGSFIYIDVILMILGGILSIALRTREALPAPPM